MPAVAVVVVGACATGWASAIAAAGPVMGVDGRCPWFLRWPRWFLPEEKKVTLKTSKKYYDE